MTTEFDLERHPGVPRRTFYRASYVEGTPKEGLERWLACIDPMGALDGLAEGDEYSLELETGDRLDGVVAERSSSGVALRVRNLNDAWWAGGSGVSGGPDDRSGRTFVSTTLNTWGVDEPAFEALKERLRPWWREHFPAA